MAVLIVSCDNYSDLWPTFFELFRRFWPDCPYPVYLLSNRKQCPEPGVSTIAVGDDISWSDNLKTALEQIPEKYVLMWIDDLLLLKPVDNIRLAQVCLSFKELEGNYLRLNPTIKADAPCNELFGTVSPGTIYRASTVLSLWRKTVLDDLLKAGESAWDFEIHGTVRSDSYARFFAAHEDLFVVENGVIKGKWRNKAYKAISALCPDLDLSHRSRMNLREEMTLSMKLLRSRVLNLFPPRYRRIIKEFVLRGKYDYRLSDNGEERT
jgi:hypothetical protein